MNIEHYHDYFRRVPNYKKVRVRYNPFRLTTSELLLKNKLVHVAEILDISAEQLLKFKGLNGYGFKYLKEDITIFCNYYNLNIPKWVVDIKVARTNRYTSSAPKGTRIDLYIPNGDNDIRNHIKFNDATYLMSFGINTIDQLLEMEVRHLISLKGCGGARLRSILTGICEYLNDGTTVDELLQQEKERERKEHELFIKTKTKTVELLNNFSANIEIQSDGKELFVNEYKVNLETGNLTMREAEVLKQRYIEKKTLEQVGNYFGITRERIRQIQTKGVRKLRDYYKRVVLVREYPYLSIDTSYIKDTLILKES